MKSKTTAVGLPRALALALVAALAVLAGCAHPPPASGPAPGTSQGAAAPTSTDPHAATAAPSLGAGPGAVSTYDVTGEPLVKGFLVGKPKTFGNLTVFPILAKVQPNVGPVTSLDAALEAGKAEVREIGAPPAGTEQDVPVQQAALPQRQERNTLAQQPAPNQPIQPVVSLPGGSAEVGTLVIDNKGTIPIYVLAGTVVKGGKQDRQIGQDFIVPPLSKVPVDAFCVEQGRWTATREGKATGGKFKTLKQLATSKVRAAGQYEGNQGKVWMKVAEVNAANQKSAASDTLLATLDDPEVAAKRDDLTKQVTGYLAAVTPSRAVVGFAYAVDGKVEGARWFANHDLFALFREALVNTSAIDSLTAQAGGPAKPPAPVAAKEITRFVEEVDRAAEKKTRETQGANVNQYQESDRAYGSTTVIKRPGKPAVELSSDYVKK